MGKFLSLFTFLIWVSVPLMGNNPLQQDSKLHRIYADEEQSIDQSRVLIFIDQSGEKEFDYIQSVPDNFYSTLSQFGTLNTDYTYWLKFKLQNTTNQELSFILFTGTNSHETIYFYPQGPG